MSEPLISSSFAFLQILLLGFLSHNGLLLVSAFLAVTGYPLMDGMREKTPSMAAATSPLVLAATAVVVLVATSSATSAFLVSILGNSRYRHWYRTRLLTS